MALVAVVSTTLSITARAQDARSELARRDLLERADRARSVGDHATALDLATQAAQVRQTPSLRLLLAQEHRAAGHLLDALDHASACVREAETDGSLRNRERLIDVCRTLSSEVEPLVAHLTVRVVPASAPALRVRVGDADLPLSLLGVPSPLMPGRVVVRVEAAGFRGASREAVAIAGRTTQVEVELAPDRASSPTVTVGRETTPLDARTTQASRPGAGPWVVVGVGTASLAAGVVLFLISNTERDRRDAACGVGGCQSSALDDDASYRRFLYGADVALGVGGAAVAGGLVWWLLSPRSARMSTAAIVPSREGAVVQIGGRF